MRYVTHARFPPRVSTTTVRETTEGDIRFLGATRLDPSLVTSCCHLSEYSFYYIESKPGGSHF